MVVLYPLALESDRCTIEGVVTKVENDKVHFRSDTKYLLYFDERPSLIPGDKLRIRGRFFNVEEKDIPHAFSYSSYLRSSGFHGAFAVEEHTKIEHNFHLGQINHSVKSYIGLAFDEPVRKYIMMLAIGDDSLLESETAAQAQELGISHLFAISGMHVGLLFGAIGSLLKRLYLQLSTYRVLLIFFMIAYNLITGFRVSIIRASILMGTIQLMNEKSNSLSRLDVLALTMLALLVMNPFYLESLGFVLSFLVSIVLILGRNYLKSQNFLIRLVKLTLLANLFSLPLILETNGSFGLMTLPANVLFIVLVEFVMLPGAFLTLILPILEPLYCLVIGIFEFFLHIFESINLPLLMNLADPLSKSLFYLLLLVFFLNTHGNKRRSRAVLGILLLLTFNLSGFSLSTQVYLLDVGDGDSLFIRTPTSKVLIDTGSQDAYDTLAGFLRAENVHRLDCLVITHWHEDHYGEIGDILAIVDVQRIIANRDPEFNIGNLRVEVPKSGTNLVCGNLKFAVLHG
ncbi:MAG: ComEC/Rec2 family competence protein, partial [Bacilli bacterium]|nr:ComEC/Rec2 family competence protein [Bacilli bacterium]